MKLAIITDSHFGIKSDSTIFLEYFENFFNSVLFPYLKKHSITHVLHLGDWNDRRKYISYSTLHFVQNKIVKKFEENGIHVDLIIGNHDTFHKNTNEINSPSQLLANSPSFNVITEPTEIEFDGCVIAMIPWICPENQQRVFEFLKNTKAPICAGHFEIQGFHVIRGTPSEHGISPKILDKFETVFSGHFHFKQDDGHIFYLGTFCDHNYGDVFEKKGFHVFDTTTRELEFIENPDKLYTRIIYSEGFEDDLSLFTKKYVKVIVKAKTDPIKYEKFLEALDKAEPYDINIIDETEITLASPEDCIDEGMDTISIIASEIDALKLESGASLKTLMTEVYTEAQELEI